MNPVVRYILLGLLAYGLFRMLFPRQKQAGKSKPAPLSTDLQYCATCQAYVSSPHQCDPKKESAPKS